MLYITDDLDILISNKVIQEKKNRQVDDFQQVQLELELPLPFSYEKDKKEKDLDNYSSVIIIDLN